MNTDTDKRPAAKPQWRVKPINYSFSEAAASLGVSERTLRAMMKGGDNVPFFKMGERVLFPVDRLREWANRQPESK
jgi:excisionase family DNA binding protein